MSLAPYLSFPGNCETAFQFYESSVGGKIEGIFYWQGTPIADTVPAEWGPKVMHARMVIGDCELMGVDTPPSDYKKPQGISIMLEVADAAEAERVFKNLSENGKVQMPLGETFWALRFGMLVDQFDIPWLISCPQPIAG